MGNLIKISKNNATSLKLYFDNGELKILDINNILNSDLPEAQKKRWDIMYKNGKFFNCEVELGDLVWPGWCELFSEDFNKFTQEVV